MLYRQGRFQIQSGDLLAWRGRGPVSWLIRTVTGGSWTHVGIAVWLGERLFVVEAREFRGVVISPTSRRLDFDHLMTECELNERAVDQLLLRVGHKYSYIDALRAGLGMKFKGKGDICSEFAANFLRRWSPNRAIPANPTPSALVEFYLNDDAVMRTLQKG